MMSSMSRAIIRCNNFLTRLRRVRVPPGNLLLLAPHCLRRRDCALSATDDLDACTGCGRCDIAQLAALCRRLGVQTHLASGGRRAVATLRHPSVKAVVAVACEKELRDGIMAAFPKPVLAIPNQLPNGPCVDTRVEVEQVRQAIESLLDSSDKYGEF